jgi:CBS domain-containing protein
MPIVETRSVLSGILVSEAMRRQVLGLPLSSTVGQAIRLMIRFKANAVLLTESGIPCGVVSKTDLMNTFYAEFPSETPLGDIMGSQPIACFPDDPVEDALEIMEAAGVHRLYVTGAHRQEVIGTIAYMDIVGLLYRYCRACERGITKKRLKQGGLETSARLTVREVMTMGVLTGGAGDPLYSVIETLSAHHLGAVLVEDEARAATGVISKTDLVIAYHHGLPPATEARQIMKTPVFSVPAESRLSEAIQQMLMWDVQRIFVHTDASDPDRISGVLALSDAARFRSGSCRACTAGRMLAH